jgi:membrane-associated protease RseP (regulator of RpoE activity)
MVFPYRTPASIEPENITARSVALDRWLRAVSFAAVVFLLSAAALMLGLLRSLAELRLSSGSSAAKVAAIAATPKPPSPSPSPPKAPPPRRDAPQAASTFAPPLGLAALGAVTHDPAALLARASKLLADGADLTITRSTLPMSIDRALEESFAPHARIAARVASGGIEIQSLPLGSTASLAGLQRGDVLTAINGYALTTPEAALDSYSNLTTTEIVVLEVLRGEHRVVLDARFSRSPRPVPRAK